MHLKKFLLFGLIAAVLPAFAEEAADRKTATSLKYVEHELSTRQNKFGVDTNKAMEYTDSAGTVQKRTVKSDLGSDTTDTSLPMVGGVNTKLNQKQDDIAAVNDHTAVTYTGQPGGIGQKGIYQATGTYTEQADNLIDAKTFNAALKTGLDNEFKCKEFKPDTDLCWVYSIHNPTTDNTLLPTGYTPLEWIESDGTQWIDTEIKLAGTDVVETEFKNSSATGYGAIYGVYETGESSAFYAYQTYYAYDSTNTKVNTNIPVDTNWHKIVHDFVSGRLSIDNNTVNFTPFSFTNTANNYLFARYYGGSYGYYFNGSIKSYKVYRNGELIQNLVPARHGNDVGMYDTIGRDFKASGSGTFRAGPEINANLYIPQEQ